MVATLAPTNTEVACGWLRSIGMPGVSMSLPEQKQGEPFPWPNGYVTVSVVGGSPGLYLPVAQPVLQIDCWAASPGSSRPPWGKANALVEAIRSATYDQTAISQPFALPNGYKSARVLSAYLLMEPRRMTDSNTSYARYMTQLMMFWTF